MQERSSKYEEELIQKLFQDLKVIIGYRDVLLNDSKVEEFYRDLDIRPGNYLQSLKNITSHSLKKIRFSESEKNDLLLDEKLLEPNAFYITRLNSIGI